MIIEQRDVENAYRKLKSYYYHDNTSLFFRKKFAEFESNGYFEDSIKQLTLFLQNSNEPEYIDYFNTLLDRISFHCIPKRIELPKKKKL